jgi:glutamate---cysteine ligase / carboxylate-amine ligase
MRWRRSYDPDPMEHSFGREAPFALGMEEELLLLDPSDGRLAHDSSRLVPLVDPGGAGTVMHDVYEALVEDASPIVPDAIEGARKLDALRQAVRDAGGTPVGAGIHPDAPFGDAPHVVDERYAEIGAQMRGLLRRTPTCALHIHVGMPDPETAIRAFNRMRQHLPALQALAAHSPFWHGIDSGFQTARAQLFRGYPRADIPRPFDGWDDYVTTMDQLVAAAGIEDYTFLWWDLRPHPKLGTLEIRAMDAQARIGSVCGLAALVHGLVLAAAHDDGPIELLPRELLVESSYRAGRDGLGATVWHAGALRPIREPIAEALALARRHTPAPAALEEVERILAEGNGADRMRAAHAGGGMPAVLRLLIEESAAALAA